AYMVNTLTKLEKFTLTSAVEFNLQIQRHPSLKELHAPMLESIGDNAFVYCYSLTSVNLPAATNIGERAFAYCNSLTNVSLPAATNIGERAFAYCNSLTNVSLPAATSIGGSAFAYCNALTNVSIPNTSNIGNYAFSNCYALTSVNLIAATSIGSWTFENCSAFTFLELGTTPPTLGYSSFYGCPRPRYLQMPMANADAYKNDNDGDTNDNLWHGWLINVQPAPLTVKVNGGAEHTGSSLHEAIAASGADPANVTQLEVLSGDLLASDAAYMVNTLTKFEKLTLTNAVEFNLQIQRHPSLKELQAPMLESISDYAFYGCASLTSVNLPAATSIGERAFSNCHNLTSVNLPAATIVGEGAFAYCDALTSVSLSAATSIGNGAFENCHNLTNVNLPAATIVGEGAFAYCDALTSVSLPAAISIGENAFNYCKQLIFFNLRATPPTLKNKYVFDGCPSPRYLMLVDAEGNLLTGNELTTAQNAYRANAGWSTIMQTWHGWTLSEGFLIRALPAEGGTVIGAGNYAKGSDVSLTAIPNRGYSFVMWSENGSQVSSADTYTFECTANRTLTAVFEAHTYTLSYTAGEGGSISGQATQTVKHGQSGIEVEAVPNAGYRFVKWSDGLTTAKRTDSNVQEDMSVTAEFEKDSSDEGGSNTGLFDIHCESLSSYPNPTTGELWVTMPELAEGIAAEVHVYNANGQQLQRVPARAASTGSAASRLCIDLSGYPSGVYIIRVGNAIAKVVKH
ncbi:MAG: leucine-rich repeat domain-containing protein, partial [Bacteroidales bacterium]|nr:leucine-rich repeat domain-containing protein [Bacteroidales bacterium]